jgi:hypothetical protein
MFSVWRSPRNESNAIETRQTGLRSNPQISIGCLRNRVWRTAKDSVLNPPSGVRVLGDVEGRINCPDSILSGEEQEQQKADKLPPPGTQPLPFRSMVYPALFEWTHGHQS